jgi:hypothetical protein
MKTIEETHPNLCLKIDVTETSSSYRYSAKTVENLLKDVQIQTIDKQVLNDRLKHLIKTEGLSMRLALLITGSDFKEDTMVWNEK